ncbi:MAG: Gfo/Idh/MocA family protein [Candidatus Brocadiia bacterium]
MSQQPTRRQFMASSALAGLAVVASPCVRAAEGKPAPSDKLDVAIVGVGGRGRSNTGKVRGEKIVALCDVDERKLAAAAKQFPKARTYYDWRKMLDQKGIQAVVCSTTDHTHAPISVAAMKRGCHVYCEKPLAHTVHEARVVRETYNAMKERGVRTQMGTQIHAGGNYRRCVELVQAGAIGPVREAHVWCGRRGPCPKRPAEGKEPPPYLHWDLWLGPAPYRPYHPSYLPGCMTWEQRWDWGNGCLGDMGSHLIDLPFWALQLRHPLTAEARGEPRSEESYPHWLVAHWEHPARGKMPPVRLSWYDGGKKPEPPPGDDLGKWGNGILFVGDKGTLLCDYGRRVLLPQADFEGFKPPEPWIPASPGHHKEWLIACKTGSQTLCNFDYSGRLIENNLLATVAFRVGKKLQWDAEELEATNAPEAAPLIRKSYRQGWTLG